MIRIAFNTTTAVQQHSPLLPRRAILLLVAAVSGLGALPGIELLAADARQPWASARRLMQALPAMEAPVADGGHDSRTAELSPELKRARQVQFLFEVKCHECHGRKVQQGGLDFRTLESIRKGGKSGPALVAGDAENSLLVKRIVADEMPPRDVRYKLSIKPFSEGELVLLRQWIDDGAVDFPPASEAAEDDDLSITDEDRQWWAFQPPVHPNVPAVKDAGRVRTPLDGFVLSRLESAGLGFSGDADQRTMIRRLYFDLTGLTPEPAKVEAFVNDPAPDAYEQLVELLLASPAYGERWGQHWLDAAGYADSEGSLGSDPVYPEVYRYRDYVIRSLNADKPYDRFLLEQLAGDELVDSHNMPAMTPAIADNLIATGYLRMCIDPTTSPETNFLYDRYQVLADTVEIVSSSLMGLTMRCARCHSHKYDPIPQTDYYRFTAIFAAALAPADWVRPNDRFLVLNTPAEQEIVNRHNAAVDEQLSSMRGELDRLTQSYSDRLFEQRLATLPESIREDTKQAVLAKAEDRSEVQKYLAEKFGPLLKIEPKDLAEAFPEFAAQSAKLDASIRSTDARRKSPPRAHGLTDMSSEPLPFYFLKRGEWDNRGGLVSPNVPAVLSPQLQPFRAEKPWPDATASGCRLALARWLTQPHHPLTGRVIVNRIWQQCFGRGIVATADDFGRTGVPPTHPELLDWLAAELTGGGWSLKHIHRLIVTSTVYRQQSAVRSEAVAVDPQNTLLWRMPLKRRDAEALRDGTAAVAGSLSRAMYGPAVEVSQRPDGQVVEANASGPLRRSVYMLRRRSTPLTILEAFDQPRLTTNCVQRRTSTVVSQALLMLNSEFAEAQAARLGERIIDDVGDDRQKQVDAVYERVFGRPPQPAEEEQGLQFLIDETQLNANGASNQAEARRLALVDYCLVLLNSAGFLYVE